MKELFGALLVPTIEHQELLYNSIGGGAPPRAEKIGNQWVIAFSYPLTWSKLALILAWNFQSDPMGLDHLWRYRGAPCGRQGATGISGAFRAATTALEVLQNARFELPPFKWGKIITINSNYLELPLN